MGWRDRGYARDDTPYHDSGMGQSNLGSFFPKPGPAVRWLLIANGVVFVLQIFLDQPRPGDSRDWGWMSTWLGVTVAGWWQIWRYLTFQFLHSLDGIWHILLNMLGLWMLGTPLETMFGTRRFVRFYLLCGAVAGLAYVVIGSLAPDMPHWVPIVGASGGVFAIILAAAVYFPHFRILVFFIISLPIRLVAAFIFGAMVFVVLSSVSKAMHGEFGAFNKAMSDVAHLGGAVTAAVWILLTRHRSRGRATVRVQDDAIKLQPGAWERQQRQRDRRQQAVDAILQKIHEHGLGSLSWREKRLLKKATDQQREEDHRIRRM